MKKRDWKMLPAVIAILAIGLFFTGCGGNGNGEEEFVAVTAISGLPTTATAGESLTLTGIAIPTYATNRTPINWTIAYDEYDFTMAEINGNVFLAGWPGKVRIRATIPNGRAEGTPFYHEFHIVVSDGSESGTGEQMPSAAALFTMGLNDTQFVAIRDTVTGGTFSWEFSPSTAWTGDRLIMSWTGATLQNFNDIADFKDVLFGTSVAVSIWNFDAGIYMASYWGPPTTAFGQVITGDYVGGDHTIGEMEWTLVID